MPALHRDYNLADGDAIYAELVAAHRGLDERQSAALNARLVLILANHIGDTAVLREAIAAALASASSSPG
ncbi:MAG TPA: DUF2783 domain-containing protein [Hyphomicrobiaceae bacterium]|nr:DUF2783 domain-containing protein [Hyphomicrobiaceae bacterium]